MRRSICVVEPAYTHAGEISTWHFKYQSAGALPKGAKLKIDMVSAGREIDWEVPDIDLKSPRNVIYGLMEDETVVAAKAIDSPHSVVPQFEFALPKGLEAGGTFTIVMGEPPQKAKVAKKGKEEPKGTRAQLTLQRRKLFNLFVDPKGKGNYDEPEAFSLDVRGNTLHTIRILAPSLVVKNRRFDVTVRFEDAFGNLTSMAPEGTLVDLSYDNLRDSLNWKLFVPETGFVTLPNLYFNEAGVYRLKLRNLSTGDIFVSPPIKCLAESDLSLYWGLLHGESERVDSTINIETCLRHFRDERNLNFVATSPFEAADETTNEVWKLISTNIATFNEEDRFSTLLGFQYVGDSPEEGIRQLIHTKDNKLLFRRKDVKYNALKKIYRAGSPKEMLSIPAFTMGPKCGFDFADFNPEYERVVEIYNAWGSSECLAKEGNPRPICSEKKGPTEFAEGSIRGALAKNCRFGFVAGGLDDRGVFSGFYEGDQVQYTPGLTAVLAAKHTRESILEALYKRACYATTGARIILGFNLSGAPMGGELSTKTKPGLSVNRHLNGYVAATEELKSVEIIRNGTVIQSFPVVGHSLEFTFDDMDDLATVVFPPVGEVPAFAYYYLRVVQADDHMAWSSPIWVDFHGKVVVAPVKKAKKG